MSERAPSEDASEAREPSEYNPYAPPASPLPAPRARGRAPKRRRRSVDTVAALMIGLYAAFSIAGIASDVAVVTGQGGHDGVIPRLIAMSLGLAWLSRRWGSIPAEEQNAIASKRVGRLGIVGYHFIPIFNLVWLFKAQIALRDGVNSVVRKNAQDKRAPRDAAVIAPLVHLCGSFAIPMLNTSIAFFAPITLVSIAWLVHMVLIERAWAYRRKLPL